MTGHWEHFAHEADIGVRGIGATREAAFAQAALALTAVVTAPESVRVEQRVSIEVSGEDDELLLFNWLNALIFEMATRRMLFAHFDLAIEGHTLRAQVYGEPVDIARHQPAVEVKGATFTALKVAQLPDGRHLAQCVVDV